MKHLLLLLLTTAAAFCALSQNRYDIIITEVMADPSPTVNLPNTEWIELTNTSTQPVNLQGWRIADASGQSGAMPNFILQPDQFVIVCTGSAVTALSAYGSTIAVTSFPSLDNDGELLYLKATNGTVIHAVNYSSAWYKNELKKEGGWSLEMIDIKNACGGADNWKASTDAAGGTPGKKNAANGTTVDDKGPQLKNAYTIDNSTIMILFNEPLDSLTGAVITNYTIDGGIQVSSAETIAPLFDRVKIKTITPLAENHVYIITASNISDCKGNTGGTANTIQTGLPANTVANNCVINEILFNPLPNAYDYVEFYNKSSHILDASKLYIANRNSSNVISSITQLSSTTVYIFPGQYWVATPDADKLAMSYLVKHPENIFVTTLPSFADDKGSVLLLNQQGDIIDEVDYTADWHFKLIDNAEGVSLERVDPAANSQNADNWHSAASTAGYGTPTYQNSQFKNQQPVTAAITIQPAIFSPDNDGFDDIATIQYKAEQAGYVANIIIFDAAGRPVKTLVKNESLGLTGYWNWDGLNEKGGKLPVGTYIIFTEIFNLQGKKQRFKNTVVLARKLN